MVRELEKGIGQESLPRTRLGVLEGLFDRNETVVVNSSQGPFTLFFGIDTEAEDNRYIIHIPETGSTVRGATPIIPVITLRPVFLASKVLNMVEARVAELNSI